jgi:hypothetical protein
VFDTYCVFCEAWTEFFKRVFTLKIDGRFEETDRLHLQGGSKQAKSQHEAGRK